MILVCIIYIYILKAVLPQRLALCSSHCQDTTKSLVFALCAQSDDGHENTEHSERTVLMVTGNSTMHTQVDL